MDTKKKKMASRRDVIRKMFQGAGFLGMGGFAWGAYIDKAKAGELILRPPGAIEKDDFLKACIKCGACVEACPYDTLILAEPGDNKPVGTPYFEPRIIPCEMCPDIPCVPVCPSGALNEESVTSFDEKENKNILDINKAKMGVAVIDEKSCVAFWGIQCDLCYRACPIMDEAISLKYERNERTGKHAFLKPVINKDVCTGCGLCEHACVTERAAIRILPIEIATGKVGDHYIKGWDKKDENRLKKVEDDEQKEDKNNSGTSDKAMDYLNGDWQEIID